MSESNKIELAGVFAQGYGIIPKMVMRATDIGPYAKLVLAYMLSYTGGGCECFPSYKRIGEDLRISAPTISKSIKNLIKAGYITVSKLYPENPLKHNNKYTISFLNDVKSRSKSRETTHAARFTSNNNKNNKRTAPLKSYQEQLNELYGNNHLL
jgi:hypothetical protein